MKIVSHEIQMSSQRTASERHIQQERLRVWIDNPGHPARQPAEQAAARFVPNDSVNLSLPAQQAQPVKKQGEIEEESVEPIISTKLDALIRLVEHLTGKKIKFFDPSSLKEPEAVEAVGPNAVDPNAGGQTPQRRGGFGIEYDYFEARIEEEHTSFSAAGVVKTADGKEINVELELNMSRRFMEEQSISFRAGDARLKDPLVLNFDGAAAELQETKFSFDLDSDGTEDQINLLDSGSGFLAQDHNKDGTINNGSELFGTQSGNGFADLSAYDEDGNRWIDENDSVYSKLRIWTRDASGNDQLFALGQKNVGAIYLGNINTQFDLKDSNNDLQGQVVSSSIFLGETGGVGTVQQLNLVV